MGILCCHYFEVLKQENIVLIEEKYIVNCWRKDFKILTLLKMLDKVFIVFIILFFFILYNILFHIVCIFSYTILYRRANPIIEDMLDIACVDQQTSDKPIEKLIVVKDELYGI
jgi:hypothetical protein